MRFGKKFNDQKGKYKRSKEFADKLRSNCGSLTLIPWDLKGLALSLNNLSMQTDETRTKTNRATDISLCLLKPKPKQTELQT